MVQSRWKQSCRKIISCSSNLPLKPENSSPLWHCANSIWYFLSVDHSVERVTLGTNGHCLWNYTHATLPATDGQWMHIPMKLFSCVAPLPFKTRCTSRGCSDKAEVSELKQTSLHITVLSKQPARAWGRDQQAVILLMAPCFFPLCYMEPESKRWAGERLVSGLQCLQVNSEGFPCCAVCIKI